MGQEGRLGPGHGGRWTQTITGPDRDGATEGAKTDGDKGRRRMIRKEGKTRGLEEDSQETEDPGEEEACKQRTTVGQDHDSRTGHTETIWSQLGVG